jgi:hypothetical protein
MMTHETILKLPDPLLREACNLARARELTVGQIVRDALSAELRRARRKAGKRLKALEVEVAPVRAELAHDLAEARDWSDLQARLANKGYVLRHVGGGLSLYRLVGDARICTASDLGPGYGKLMERFGKPMPAASVRKQPDLPLEDAVIDF